MLVSDDAVLRREARGVEIPILGTTEVVLLMKPQGLLGAIKPVLDLMQARGYQIEASLYAQALSVAGEE